VVWRCRKLPAQWGAAARHVLLALAGGLVATPAPAADIPRVLLDTTVELSRRATFLGADLLVAPSGLDADGVLFRVLIGHSLYSYGAPPIDGRGTLGHVSAGYRLGVPAGSLKLYAGALVTHHDTDRPDPFHPLTGTRTGFRAEADLWHEPLPGAVAVHAGVVATTLHAGWWARAALGFRVADAAWVGPEVHATGDRDGTAFGFGLHLTGLRLGSTEIGSRAGLRLDAAGVAGGYGKVSVIRRW
jgi:hypothetical protein